MKINLVSDLHLNWGDLKLPGGDILIMAGDVFDAYYFNIKDESTHKTKITIRDVYNRFIDEELSKYNTVLYVMGNHEHYRFKYLDTHETLTKHLPSNTYLLENETINIDGIMFFGATFWTDYNKRDPLAMYHVGMGMNDYKHIKLPSAYSPYGYSNLTTDFIASVHDGSKAALVESMKLLSPSDKMVVITHHAPSFSSSAPWFADDIISHAYCSNLDNFILDNPQIKVWVHGHHHHTSDYMIGSTRIMCNPRGYHGYEPCAKLFDPGFGFDV